MIHNLKLVTYNINGLPNKIDLNDLPWAFKPLVWIYKLIKKTTIIQLSNENDKSKMIKHISKCLYESEASLIGIQEDFNYHDEVMSSLPYHNSGKYIGKFNLSKVFSNVDWFSHFPLPRFKSDGLNILYNKNRIKVNKEDIVKWKKSYGYFTHANDLFAHKGFRFYDITLDNEIDLDVYIIHMDADFYHAEKCPDVSKDVEARKSQFKQLTQYIIDRYDAGANNPIIIMGDTNSYDKYEWDVNNINDNFLFPINDIPGLSINEVTSNMYNDVDKIFYINIINAKYKIRSTKGWYDDSFNSEIGRVSDHKPFITTLMIY